MIWRFNRITNRSVKKHVANIFWVNGYREPPAKGRPEYSTELPFPNRGISASAELLKEYYRPTPTIPRRLAKGYCAAFSVICDVRIVGLDKTRSALDGPTQMTCYPCLWLFNKLYFPCFKRIFCTDNSKLALLHQLLEHL